jgi:hypothetical protein
MGDDTWTSVYDRNGGPTGITAPNANGVNHQHTAINRDSNAGYGDGRADLTPKN